MNFKFHNYDLAELEACGQAFVVKFRTARLSTYPEWTAAVTDWFADAHGPGVCVYPAAPSCKEEFMVDQCHITYPIRMETEAWPSVAWWERAMKGPCRMKLALESEWGKWRYADQSLVMVLDDACKLAFLRSQLKVIIYSSHWDDPQDRILTALRNIRRCHDDPDPWLCVDVVNDPEDRIPRNIRRETLSG